MQYLRKITGYLPKSFKKNKYFSSYFQYVLVVFFGMLILAFASVLISLNSKYITAKTSRSLKIRDYAYWQEMVQKYPNSPDVEFNAAKSAYEVGDFAKAQTYIDKALDIDPLFVAAQKLNNKIKG